jgi:hypothetical protein
MVDLAFSEGLGSTDLVFGEVGPSPDILQLGLAVTLPAPTFAGRLQSGALPLSSSAALPAIVSSCPIALVPPIQVDAELGLAVTLPAAIFAGRLRSGALPLSSAAALPAIVPSCPIALVPPVQVDAELGLAVTLPAAIFAGRLRSGALPLSSAAALPAIVSSCPISRVPAMALQGHATSDAELPEVAIAYDNAVNRAPFRWASDRWSRAAAQSADCHSPHLSTRSRQVAMISTIATATPRRSFSAPGWQSMSPSRRPAMRLLWGAATHRESVLEQSYRYLAMDLRPTLAVPLAECDPRALVILSKWSELQRRPRPVMPMPWGNGQRSLLMIVTPSAVCTAQRSAWRIPWQTGRHPPHGVRPPVNPPDPDDRYIPNPHLLFDDAWPASLNLVFGRPPRPARRASVIIPVLRSYLVVNDVTLMRTSDNLALPAITLSLSIDADSWCWGWETSLPATALEDVLPSGPGAPIEFEASINGVKFLLLGEKVTRDRRFGQARITVSGRGIAAELGDPYAAVVSRSHIEDRNAQQLMADALMVSGVGIGWSLDWSLTDWLVPAGIWAHTGTHIEAVIRIAEAAGGYVQAARNSRTLAILPRYPVAPWDWFGVIPDYSLPSAATTREGIEWLEKPAYNAVYVSGEGAGILARVVRAGSAGDQAAPMIVDALTTHADMARQQILTLETPIFPGVGIYPVGSFVEFADGAESRLGIVRSVSINAAFPTVRQTIEVECHA